MSEKVSKSMGWIESTIVEGINKGLNKAISLDYQAKKKLSSFEGKKIRVDLDSTPFRLLLSVVGDELNVSPIKDESIEADTTIKGTPLALFAMNSSEPIEGLPSVQISGDASTGQFFQKWLKNVNPDWEEAWCQLLGDSLGVRVSDTAKSILSFGKKFKESMLNNSKEYLVEESRDLLAPCEVDDFLDDVDDLKSDVEGLEYRINQIKNSLS